MTQHISPTHWPARLVLRSSGQVCGVQHEQFPSEAQGPGVVARRHPQALHYVLALKAHTVVLQCGGTHAFPAHALFFELVQPSVGRQ